MRLSLVVLLAAAIVVASPALPVHAGAGSDRPASANCIGEEGEDADEARVAEVVTEAIARGAGIHGSDELEDAARDGVIELTVADVVRPCRGARRIAGHRHG